MNQTTWILLGGVAVIAFAGMLYVLSGDDAIPQEKKQPLVEIETVELEADPVIETTRTTPAPPRDKTASSDETPTPVVDPIVTLRTNMGDITLKLYAKDAPIATENFLKLARSGFYDGVKFHRVIQDFMIQAGDPLSKDDAKTELWGTGGPGYTFANESSGRKFVRGSLGMANYGGTNTNGSQFFIVTASTAPFLDGGYTNFGEVIEGLDIALKIEKVKTDGSAQFGTGNDRPLSPVVINNITIR
jgi:peptidylprolyl isomerase